MSSILILPESPSATGSPAQWQSVENVLGTPFPTDYKEFVGQFGSGYIDNFLWILSPFEDHQYLNVVWQLSERRDIHRILREAVGHDELPYGFFPDQNGLLPWGSTDEGDMLYWVTNDMGPDRWTVLIEPRDQGWDELNVGMTECLAKLLTREYQPFGDADDDFPASPLPLPYGLPEDLGVLR